MQIIEVRRVPHVLTLENLLLLYKQEYRGQFVAADVQGMIHNATNAVWLDDWVPVIGFTYLHRGILRRRTRAVRVQVHDVGNGLEMSGVLSPTQSWIRIILPDY